MSALSDHLANLKAKNDWSLDLITDRAREGGHPIDRATVHRYVNGGTAKWPSEKTIQALAAGFEMDEREVRRLAAVPPGEREPWVPPDDSAKLTREQRLALDTLIKTIVKGGGRAARTPTPAGDEAHPSDVEAAPNLADAVTVDGDPRLGGWAGEPDTSDPGDLSPGSDGADATKRATERATPPQI